MSRSDWKEIDSSKKHGGQGTISRVMHVSEGIKGARKELRPASKKYLNDFAVTRVSFNFHDGLWNSGKYLLPKITIKGKDQFVLLVPKNMLTKESTWIASNDLL